MRRFRKKGREGKGKAREGGWVKRRRRGSWRGRV